MLLLLFIFMKKIHSSKTLKEPMENLSHSNSDPEGSSRIDYSGTLQRSKDRIIIRGARQHNLKNINLEIPRDRFVVITGLSGSGKSSLAFDTIYAEGQRRYIESLSAYARQFLGQMDKPDVDYIEAFPRRFQSSRGQQLRTPDRLLQL